MPMTNVSGKVVAVSCEWYMFVSLCNLAFRMGEMSLPSRACSNTEIKEVGWEVISNAPVGTTSRSRLIGWVV
jgi:hypothetical protein